jgi:hypothetical protein
VESGRRKLSERGLANRQAGLAELKGFCGLIKATLLIQTILPKLVQTILSEVEVWDEHFGFGQHRCVTHLYRIPLGIFN